MSRLGRFRRLIVAAALSGPIVFLVAAPAAADRRHDDGYGSRHRHHGHHDRHRGHHRGHHRGGVSGLFVFDFSPPPPRRVYAPPHRVYAKPPVVYQAPPPVVYRAPPPVSYQAAPQNYCREYTMTTMVGGRPVEAYGTACMQPDGSWRIVSMN